MSTKCFKICFDKGGTEDYQVNLFLALLNLVRLPLKHLSRLRRNKKSRIIQNNYAEGEEPILFIYKIDFCLCLLDRFLPIGRSLP